jgi:hypothetical protein
MPRSPGLSSRRNFLKNTALATIDLAFFGQNLSASGQKAAVTAAQMRAGGATTKITVLASRRERADGFGGEHPGHIGLRRQAYC